MWAKPGTLARIISVKASISKFPSDGREGRRSSGAGAPGKEDLLQAAWGQGRKGSERCPDDPAVQPRALPSSARLGATSDLSLGAALTRLLSMC